MGTGWREICYRREQRVRRARSRIIGSSSRQSVWNNRQSEHSMPLCHYGVRREVRVRVRQSRADLQAVDGEEGGALVVDLVQVVGNVEVDQLLLHNVLLGDQTDGVRIA